MVGIRGWATRIGEAVESLWGITCVRGYLGTWVRYLATWCAKRAMIPHLTTPTPPGSEAEAVAAGAEEAGAETILTQGQLRRHLGIAVMMGAGAGAGASAGAPSSGPGPGPAPGPRPGAVAPRSRSTEPSTADWYSRSAGAWGPSHPFSSDTIGYDE